MLKKKKDKKVDNSEIQAPQFSRISKGNEQRQTLFKTKNTYDNE
jgi:hypothetical protein